MSDPDDPRTHVCTSAVQESVATIFAKMHGTEECSVQACL